LSLLLDVGVDEERVGLRVDILHHNLESIEASGFWDLHFATEALDQVLVDNSVRGRKKREDVGDEVTLVIVHSVVPVVDILGEINFLGSPKGSLGLLVHLPDLLWESLVGQNTLRVARRRWGTHVMVLNWKEHEALRVLLKQRLVLVCFFRLDRRCNSNGLPFLDCLN
jgi:hypothetical protein